MAETIALRREPAPAATVRAATAEQPWIKWLLVAITLGFLTFFLFVPLLAIFTEALRKGAAAYFASFNEPAALAAVKLTLLTAAVAVPLNLVFGLAAAWAIAATLIGYLVLRKLRPEIRDAL